MSFKLLAIRPLEGCNPKFLKNLEKNRIYQFYNDYEFQDEKGNVIDTFGKENYFEVCKIKHTPTVPDNLYGDKINISAIVGKNGSGKSSLVELLYVFIYNFSIKNGIFPKTQYFIAFKRLKEDLSLFLKKIRLTIIQEIKDESQKKKLELLIEKSDLETFSEEINSIIADKERKILSFFTEIFRELKGIDFIDKTYSEIEWKDLKSKFTSFFDYFKNELKILNYGSTFTDEIYNIEYQIDELEVEFYKIPFLVESVYLDLFYSIDDTIFSIQKTDKRNFKIVKYKKDSIESIFRKIENQNINEYNFNLDFYNLINNYSLYGLNSNEIGEWINKIFHKNDGYKTPIVINPFRKNGNIDVNLEHYFTKNRLISNVLDIKSKNKLIENKKASFLILKEKEKDYFINPLKNNKEKYKKILVSIFNTIYISDSEKMDYTIEDTLIKKIANNPTPIENKTINYIFYKLGKIANQYDLQFNYLDENKYLDFLQKLKKKFSDSHILFKIYQSIHFLKYDIYNEIKNNTFDEIRISLEDDLSIPKKIYGLRKKLIDQIRDKVDDDTTIIIYPDLLLNNMAFLPPPVYEIDLEFGNNQGKLSDLSSGEKQFIHSIQSIRYHLLNLSSKFSWRSNLSNKYEYINIVLDEIELYFHPEMQRKFLFELIKVINYEYLRQIKCINIVFITHSPFILSDIPKQNVLFLENGKPSEKKNMNTFGANITDLLADSFFIEDGLMGDFAKEKIKETIEWLTNKERDESKKEHFKKIIEIIDEPLLNYKLKEMYFALYPVDEKEYIRKKAIKLGLINE